MGEDFQGGKTGLSKSDIMACREAFWKLDENKQRNYILTFFSQMPQSPLDIKISSTL